MSLKENLELDEKIGREKHHVDILGKNLNVAPQIRVDLKHLSWLLMLLWY